VGTRGYPSDAAGSLRPYGLELTFGPGEPVLPLSLTIGRWLLDHVIAAIETIDDGARRRVPVRFQGIAADAPPGECLRLGRELAGAADLVAMLVMGDGSACRPENASGALDERAEPYDAAVARALGDADADALAALDPALARELHVAGRAAWQVLAGAAGAGGAGRGPDVGGSNGSGGFDGAVLAEMAPYGVAYFVAAWWPRSRPERASADHHGGGQPPRPGGPG
jgi:hypothetical protein